MVLELVFESKSIYNKYKEALSIHLELSDLTKKWKAGPSTIRAQTSAPTPCCGQPAKN